MQQQPESVLTFSRATLHDFLDGLSSAAPTPGGGAAAALVGAMSAALISMVCNLTIGRPRYSAVESAMKAILVHSERARTRLLQLADEDALAYSGVTAAYKLPRGSTEERSQRAVAIQQALERAAEPPLAVLAESRSLLPLCLEVAAHGNVNVVSDAGVAAELCVAAVRSSLLNVRVNLTEAKSEAFVARCEMAMRDAENGLDAELDRVIAIVRAKTAPKERR
jgi:formiminotetrahydrofolate cyclodeaminase